MIRSWMVGRAAAALMIVGVGCGDEVPAKRDAHVVGNLQQALGQGAQAPVGEERFGLIVRLPVSWPQNTGLESGSGELEHRVLVVRREGAPDALTLCALGTPGYKTRAFVGGEAYTFTFEPEALHNEALSRLHIEHGEGGVPVRLGVSLGAHVGDVFADAWPSAGRLNELAARSDDTLGMTLVPTGVHPPVNRARTRRAEQFFVALRHAFALELGSEEAGRRTGIARALEGHGRELIDSTTLGCRIDGATVAKDAHCSRVELYLANAFAPSYRSGAGVADFVRMPDGASCGDILGLSL